ncbi:uncharacterized protein LOC144513238 [Sander vitreus]
MAATEDQTDRAAKYMEDPFRSNAFLIINTMLELNSERPTVLVDEILHSIFFLGKINDPQHPPESIVTDAEMLEGLKNTYPRPFVHYSSQMPKRSPFSCVLDMIVLLTGEEKEEEIKEKVREITKQLRRGKTRPLISSTICVSQIPNSDRYYGVSMSTSGPKPGRIMVAASCLSSWDKYVAGAVMTYPPNKAKKRCFDGTMRLPENVRCEASNILQGTPLPPCRSCKNLFFKTDVTKEWPYGHCAEVESLSNLFRNVEEVREQARPTSANSTEENRLRAEESVKTELRRLLEEHNFTWDGEYFTPQHP